MGTTCLVTPERLPAIGHQKPLVLICTRRSACLLHPLHLVACPSRGHTLARTQDDGQKAEQASQVLAGPLPGTSAGVNAGGHARVITCFPPVCREARPRKAEKKKERQCPYTENVLYMQDMFTFHALC